MSQFIGQNQNETQMEDVPVYISSPSNVYISPKFKSRKQLPLFHYIIQIRDLCKKYQDENLFNVNLQYGPEISLYQIIYLYNTIDSSISLNDAERASLELFQKVISDRVSRFREFSTKIRQVMYEYLLQVFNLNFIESNSMSHKNNFDMTVFEQLNENHFDATEHKMMNIDNISQNALSLNMLLNMYSRLKGPTNPIHYAQQLLSYEEKRFIIERQVLSMVNRKLKGERIVSMNNHNGTMNISQMKVAMLSNENIALNKEVNRLRSALADVQNENIELKKEAKSTRNKFKLKIEQFNSTIEEQRSNYAKELARMQLFKQELEAEMQLFSKELERTKSDYENFMEEYNFLKSNQDAIKTKYKKKLILERQRQKDLQEKTTTAFQNQAKIYEDERINLQLRIQKLQNEQQFIHSNSLTDKPPNFHSRKCLQSRRSLNTTRS